MLGPRPRGVPTPGRLRHNIRLERPDASTNQSFQKSLMKEYTLSHIGILVMVWGIFVHLGIDLKSYRGSNFDLGYLPSLRTFESSGQNGGPS